MSGLAWSAVEDQFVRDNYEQHSDRWIAERLGRTQHGVSSRRIERLKLFCTQPHKKYRETKMTSADMERRLLFMAMILRGKKLLGKRKPKINLVKMIGAFGEVENLVGNSQ